tara:strand:+ start:376 stop:528 length:153 start_codon:yes stop_codon:yes gene_type:complete
VLGLGEIEGSAFVDATYMTTSLHGFDSLPHSKERSAGEIPDSSCVSLIAA